MSTQYECSNATEITVNLTFDKLRGRLGINRLDKNAENSTQ